jgi:hypothetical protein
MDGSAKEGRRRRGSIVYSVPQFHEAAHVSLKNKIETRLQRCRLKCALNVPPPLPKPPLVLVDVLPKRPPPVVLFAVEPKALLVVPKPVRMTCD